MSVSVKRERERARRAAYCCGDDPPNKLQPSHCWRCRCHCLFLRRCGRTLPRSFPVTLWRCSSRRWTVAVMVALVGLTANLQNAANHPARMAGNHTRRRDLKDNERRIRVRDMFPRLRLLLPALVSTVSAFLISLWHIGCSPNIGGAKKPFRRVLVGSGLQP